MKEGNHIKIYHWLLPIAWLYGLGVRVRNKMFDAGLLQSRKFDCPVICVGNITVGGTGKTPHTEYLIRLLQERYRVSTLSRGYKRRTHGFIIADAHSTVADIGDEPCQMKRKFPDVIVAVDADRCHGIERLMSLDKQLKPEVVLLDDAYQHRYVKAGLNMLLMDFHRVTYKDQLLPAGRLREPHAGIRRADVVVVTKCPCDMTDEDMGSIAHSLGLSKHQKLFFTRYAYPKQLNAGERPVLLTGIASPQQMLEDMRRMVPDVQLLSFPDHHNFTQEDLNRIRQETQGRTILTTEKDFTRLHGLDNVVVVPIEVQFVGNSKEDFDNTILNYVRLSLHENNKE